MSLDVQRLQAAQAIAKLRPDYDEPTFECVCEDVGLIESDVAGDWFPCSRCCPETYENWRKGKYLLRTGKGPNRGPSPPPTERQAERQRFGSRRDIA